MNFTETKLPHKAGCINKRGRTWWLVYFDETGKRVQVNSRTEDQEQAYFLLAAAAARVMQKKMADLRKIANAAPKKSQRTRGGSSAGSGAPDAGTVGRSGGVSSRGAGESRGGRTKAATAGEQRKETPLRVALPSWKETRRGK